jgi:hypothetical protein
MNEDACDLVDYDRSESGEFSLSPKRGCFKVGFLLIFDARIIHAKTKRLNYENMVMMSGGERGPPHREASVPNCVCLVCFSGFG